MGLVQTRTSKELPKTHVISIRVNKELKEEWHKFVKDNKIQQTETFKAIMESIMNGELK